MVMRLMILVVLVAFSCVSHAIDTNDTFAMIKLYQHPNCSSESELRQLSDASDKIKARVKSWPNANEISEAIDRFNLFYNQGARISFASSQDKAILKLKKEVGLTPPPGYALIAVSRLMSMIEDSEGITKFGVTLGDRFIVLADPSAGIISTEPEKSVTEMPSFSHEMVHAFMSSYIFEQGVEDRLPMWFHEGCATYFSGDVESKTVARGYDIGQGGQVEVNAKMTEEYKKYRLVMNYLSTVYGKENFHLFIRESLKTGSCDKPLVVLFGTSDTKILFKKSRNWDFLRNLFGMGCLFWLIIAFFLISPFFSSESSAEKTKNDLNNVKIAILPMLVFILGLWALAYFSKLF